MKEPPFLSKEGGERREVLVQTGGTSIICGTKLMKGMSTREDGQSRRPAHIFYQRQGATRATGIFIPTTSSHSHSRSLALPFLLRLASIEGGHLPVSSACLMHERQLDTPMSCHLLKELRNGGVVIEIQVVAEFRLRPLGVQRRRRIDGSEAVGWRVGSSW